MKHLKIVFLLSIVSVLSAKEYTITQTAPFNPLLQNGYTLCENAAMKKIEQEARKKLHWV